MRTEIAFFPHLDLISHRRDEDTVPKALESTDLNPRPESTDVPRGSPPPIPGKTGSHDLGFFTSPFILFTYHEGHQSSLDKEE